MEKIDIFNIIIANIFYFILAVAKSAYNLNLVLSP